MLTAEDLLKSAIAHHRDALEAQGLAMHEYNAAFHADGLESGSDLALRVDDCVEREKMMRFCVSYIRGEIE